MKRMQKGILMAAMVVMFAVPFFAQAVADPTPASLGLTPGSGIGTVNLGQRQLPETIASIINAGLAILGVIAVVIIIMGGFMWMTAAGSEEKIKKAKGLMTSGVIGMAIILSAYAIATFVVTKLTDATAGRI